MPAIKVVTLESQQEDRLQNMLKKGRWTPREIKRAQILLMVNNNTHLTNEEVATKLTVGRETVRRIRNHYIEKGLEAALLDSPRPGKPKILQAHNEAYIIATACTTTLPAGHSHWTLELLMKRLSHRKKKCVSKETIQQVLLRNNLKPWRKKNVEHTQNH